MQNTMRPETKRKKLMQTHYHIQIPHNILCTTRTNRGKQTKPNKTHTHQNDTTPGKTHISRDKVAMGGGGDWEKAEIQTRYPIIILKS